MHKQNLTSKHAASSKGHARTSPGKSSPCRYLRPCCPAWSVSTSDSGEAAPVAARIANINAGEGLRPTAAAPYPPLPPPYGRIAAIALRVCCSLAVVVGVDMKAAQSRRCAASMITVAVCAAWKRSRRWAGRLAEHDCCSRRSPCLLLSFSCPRCCSHRRRRRPGAKTIDRDCCIGQRHNYVKN